MQTAFFMVLFMFYISGGPPRASTSRSIESTRWAPVEFLVGFVKALARGL